MIYTFGHASSDIAGVWPWYQTFHARREQWALEERLSPSAKEVFDWEYYDRVSSTRGTRKVTHARLDFVSTYSSDMDYAASLPLPDDIPPYAVQMSPTLQPPATLAAGLPSARGMLKRSSGNTPRE